MALSPPRPFWGPRLPSPGSLHRFNKNMTLKIGAFGLDVPGAPDPTALTGKLFPYRGKLPSAGCQHCPRAQGHLLEAQPG